MPIKSDVVFTFAFLCSKGYYNTNCHYQLNSVAAVSAAAVTAAAAAKEEDAAVVVDDDDDAKPIFQPTLV